MDSSLLDENYWDERYKTQSTGWDIGYASPAIINYAAGSIAKDAAILIPGCGNAYEAKALLAMGFSQITLLDIAPTLVAKVKREFENNPNIQILCQDFFQHQGQYDYIIEQTFFCALDPSLRPSYVQQMHTLLKPQGILMGLLFKREFAQQGPPFGGDQTEYQQLFKSKFDILHLADSTNSIPQRQGNELFFELRKKLSTCPA
ncbi:MULTISPECIES: methyltransferase domain-containing protein [Sphingobacterium]|uniref:methyltransferase domain-containing protein n=1 Tax=Sphingobacterium TaxID=28453 RepID=UPI00257D7F47|nr:MULTISPECIES: methyltransferase domain-containing protein [Sphingobacterium]